ncbi:MAG: hypothetical protein DU429_01045 [Candidatus Tokpelaia sp.]|nr:MAG: hypothetical protein DU430_02675 [Candidatus Tokpelaia sp.]KAA6207664.1 MAG: hypothetical protein DU429_01045 [Candidatus Tokpelaia sp.]KAA6404839.1 hypothetical protein DPQ22_07980 [Candidatus Tokpelaia sp.]
MQITHWPETPCLILLTALIATLLIDSAQKVRESIMRRFVPLIVAPIHGFLTADTTRNFPLCVVFLQF